jgi:hypothetical protein
MDRAAGVVAALLAACGSSRTVDTARTAATFDRVSLDTGGVHGLSGLALDADGALWTVAERGRAAFRITLDGDRLASLERVPIDGIPDETDLESIAILDDGRFVFGTESKVDGAATLLIGTRAPEGGPIAVAPRLDVEAAAGAALLPNQGVEGLCVAGGTLVLALETVEEIDGGRHARVMAEVGGGAAPLVHQVILTSDTGKLSSLDCALRGSTIDVLAIERHFGIVRLLAFDVPADPAEPITPTIYRDLGAIAKDKNPEGVARLPDGRIALVTDNQWKTVDGPSLLLLLPAAPPKVAP